MEESNFSVSNEILELESLADRSEQKLDEIESLISDLRSNKELLAILGKQKILNAINELNSLSLAHNKIIDFACCKISNNKNFKKHTLIKLFNIDNLIISFYEKNLFLENMKISKRIKNLEKVIKTASEKTNNFLNSSNDPIYYH